jgi:hypothetical protein
MKKILVFPTIYVIITSLSIGLGFTQVPDMFNIFPDIVRTILLKIVLQLFSFQQLL